jgi:AcrR family transcriptional regulator
VHSDPVDAPASEADTAPVQATGPAGWQAQKSAATRTQIVEAAIRCFVELGYSRTTTTAIAERAGLSRGAMLHHFPAKIDVVAAAVQYLHDKRLRAFRRSIGRTGPTHEDRIRQSVEAYWAHVRHPTFVAFFELSVAARTDRELAAILAPMHEAFENAWYETAREAFAGWDTQSAAFETVIGVVRYAMEGMAIPYRAQGETERDKRMLRYLESSLRGLANETAGTAESPITNDETPTT